MKIILMKNKVRLILCLLIFAILSYLDNSVLAEEFPTLPDAGVVNTHDLNSFMEFDRQKSIDDEIKRIENEDSQKQDEHKKKKKKERKNKN